MNFIRFRWLIIACAGLLMLGATADAVPLSDLPDLSPLIPYTAFGNDINLNLATVDGNTGISANGKAPMDDGRQVTMGAVDASRTARRQCAAPTRLRCIRLIRVLAE